MAKNRRNQNTLGLDEHARPLEQLNWTSLDDLATTLAASPRAFTLLTGVEAGWASLSPADIARPGYNFSVGCAFSFCLDGITYTALEDEEDGYRSSLGLLVSRQGNHCSTTFEPCALWPAFTTTEERKALDLFAHPNDPRPALSVGTRYFDEYYPSFEGHHIAELLQRAHDMGIALAWELDATLPRAPSISARPRL